MERNPGPAARPSRNRHRLGPVIACKLCGEENADKARFCNACGERLEEQSAEQFRRRDTVLFSDVVDSTGLGERVDPETKRE